MVNKQILLLVSMILLSTKCFSSKITIVQFAGYEEDTGKEFYTKINGDIYDQLSGYSFDGLISFSTPHQNTPIVYSSLEAIQVAQLLSSDYLLYGYIRKTTNSYFVEVKLYNFHTGTIEKLFFSSDDLENYNRLVFTLSKNIAEYFCLLLDIELEKGSGDIKKLTLDIPVSVGYWSPIKKDWIGEFLGIVGTGFGLQLFPELSFSFIKNTSIELSIGLEFQYRFALGRDKLEPAYLHSVHIASPVLLNCSFKPRHSLFLGLGPLYGLDILLICQRYREQETIVSNSYGLRTSLGYSYQLHPVCKIITGLDIDGYFTRNTSPTISCKVGCSFNVLEQWREQ